MRRIFYHYTDWEETYAGLWRRVSGEERQQLIAKCAIFMADTLQFQRAMAQVIQEWPISCEINFTIMAANRQAWLGRAACCLALQCPEEPTRSAWWMLTQAQRDDADTAAAMLITQWEHAYTKRVLCENVQLDLMF